jgi:hypothetical protein
MAGISTSSQLFAERGDPWMTEREQVKDFDRDPSTENPDFDQFWAASPARIKAAFVPERGTPIENDFSRRAANFMRTTNRLTQPQHIIVADNKKALANLPSIETHRKKLSQSFWIYSIDKEGNEKEVERNVGLDKAKKLFDTAVKRKNTILVELYDFRGELVHRWEKRPK